MRLAEQSVPLGRHDRGVAEDLLQSGQGATSFQPPAGERVPELVDMEVRDPRFPRGPTCRSSSASRRAQSPSCEVLPEPAPCSLPSAREPRRCPLTAHSRTSVFRQPCEDRLEHFSGDHERAFRFVPCRSLIFPGIAELPRVLGQRHGPIHQRSK